MTDPAATAAAEAAMAVLRVRYRAGTANTISAFATLADRLRAQPDAPELVETLRRELHRVRGTAGSFGFAEASRLSGAMEDRAVRWSADSRLELDDRADMVTRYVSALREAFTEVDATPRTVTPDEASARHRLLAVDLAPALAGELAAQGPLRGFDVTIRVEGDWSPTALRAVAAHVLVTTPGSASAVHAAVRETHVPIVVLDDGADAASVHRAQRLPGVQVLHVGDDLAAVFDLADRAAGRSTLSGATILVCDDDRDLLALIERIGEASGMRTETVSNPARLFDALERYRPSLLLLDLNLGNADGLAVTRAIRRMDALAGLPIVICSSQSDAATREAVMDAGADDFLQKPIVAAELRQRIGARLEATRATQLERGLHPGTGFLLPDRFREAVADRARHAAAGAFAVAAVRCAGGAPHGRALAHWHTEARRLQRLLATGALDVLCGHAEGEAIAFATRGAGSDLLTLLVRGAAERVDEAPPWHAGVAVLGASHAGVAALLEAAQDAARFAERAGAAVRVWSAAESNRAPDVIVVEDDPAIGDMLRYALESYGYSHRIFTTGTAALDALLTMQPRAGHRPLVLMDVDLPGLDGHTLHERLRVDRPGVFAVVFSTGHAAEGEQVRALRAGAIDYLVKPVSLRVLMAKLPIWLATAGSGHP